MTKTLAANPHLSNLFGQLSPEICARLQAVIDSPAEHWDDAYSIIVRGDYGFLTLWQAVIAVDPTFPKFGPTSMCDKHMKELSRSGWLRTPDQVTVARAIKYAASLPPRRSA